MISLSLLTCASVAGHPSQGERAPSAFASPLLLHSHRFETAQKAEKILSFQPIHVMCTHVNERCVAVPGC
jgi:hypothetical protein